MLKFTRIVMALIMVSSGFLTVINLNALETSNVFAEPQQVPGSFSVCQNGIEYSLGYLSASELHDMKETLGVREPGRNYNVIVGDKGTGFAPPTEEGWSRMMDKPAVRSILTPNPMLATSCDLSTEPYFPAVGDQKYQASCCAWAITYYTYGYLEAKDNNWADASTGNPEHLMSPAWTYNMVNEGIDWGSWEGDNADVIEDWGVPNLIDRPYDYRDHDSWGEEEAWRGAPLHRASEDYFIPYVGDPTVELVKSIVSGRVPVTFSMDGNQYDFSDNFIISSLEYQSDTINHVQTIVGYDDSITDDGDVGAFRVVNSWGTDFGDRGYYWMTYEAFKEIGILGLLCLTYLEDIPNYVPSLLATWEFSQTPSVDGNIDLGISDDIASLQSKTPFYNNNRYLNNREFPEFMCLDITEFEANYLSGNEIFYLHPHVTSTQGAISSFKLERYDEGYVPGRPTFRSRESVNVPLTNPCTVHSEAPFVCNLDQNTYHKTLQKAVDNASAGDTVFAPSGTYHENVRVPINLILEGECSEDTIIDASGKGTAMEITWDSVETSGFTFMNSGTTSDDAGLKLSGAEGCLITECNVISNENGLLLDSSSNNWIYHNNIINNKKQATNLGSNQWDNGYPSGGNYWSGCMNQEALNESYFTIGGETGFYLVHNQFEPMFNHILSISRFLWVYEDDWYSTYDMIEGTDFAVNITTGWVDILYGQLCLGENFYIDYTYVTDGIDDFNGPGQDIPGPDGISDTEYNVYPSLDIDRYPICNPLVDDRVQMQPIRFNSNFDFNPAHGVFSGNGTAGNPWVIEGIDIDGTDHGFAMFIGNTTDHFIIRNCNFHNASDMESWPDPQSPYYQVSGLALYNVSNAVIDNNIMSYNSWYGISLTSCSNLSIESNFIHRNWAGVFSWCCQSLGIIRNNLSFNSEAGLWLQDSHLNNLTLNRVQKNDFGIYLQSSNDNSIEMNQCLDSFVYGGIILATNSTGNIIRDNLCQNNSNHGIYILSSDSNLIEDNSCLDNGHYGISIFNSSNCEMLRNTLSDNYGGISMVNSCDNTALNNSVSGTVHKGIFLKDSVRSILLDNDMSGGGVSIEGELIENWNTHIIPQSNTANGAPILYWKDQIGGTVPSGTPQVLLANCTGSLISGLDLSNLDVGVSIGFSSDVVVKDSSMSFNTDTGIFLQYSDNSQIINNSVNSNRLDGIHLAFSCNNSLDENRCTSNDCGMHLESSDGNLITANTLMDNWQKPIVSPASETIGFGYLGKQGIMEGPRSQMLISDSDAPALRYEPIHEDTFDYSVLVEEVPAYLWYRGCGPTAMGIVMGYWDGQGFDRLVAGNASTQTQEVNEAISSQGNYDDYCLPEDDGYELFPDRSELPEGDVHADNSLADFTMTSRSYYQNWFGWQQLRHSVRGIIGYVNYMAPDYKIQIDEKYWGDLTWENFCAEIDADRPVTLTVDSNGDGYSDHAVVATGYGEQNGVRMYRCLNTWDSYQDHWFIFQEMQQGENFGIYVAIFLNLEESGHGILLSSSNGNKIFHNNIINNSVQANDDGINQWDNGYPAGGNYWFDKTESTTITYAETEFIASDSDEGFFLQNNVSNSNFKEIATVLSLIFVRYDDWSYVQEMYEGIHFTINRTTGWIEILRTVYDGEQYFADYTYESYLGVMPLDNLYGPFQNLPGADGIADYPFPIDTDSVDVYPLAAPFEYSRCAITLEKGWNLISIPFILNDMNVGKAFGSIAGKWDIVKTYDRMLNNPWTSYYSSRPGLPNSLINLDIESGYWIHITEPGISLELRGYEPYNQEEILLCAGWNLVSYPTTSTVITVGEAFWGTGASIVEICDIGSPYLIKEVGPSYVMQPGEGYWIKVPADVMWVVDW